MPIDPSILSSGGVKLQDPLEQYTNFLQAKSLINQNKMSNYKMEEVQRDRDKINALNNALNAGYDSVTGKVDYNKVRSSLATGGFASAIPDINESEGKYNKQVFDMSMSKQKAELENRKASADVSKTEAETQNVTGQAIKNRMEVVHSMLNSVTTPEQYVRLVTAQYSDPLLGKYLIDGGQSAEKDIADMQARVKNGTFADFLQEEKIGLQAHLAHQAKQTELRQAQERITMEKSKRHYIPQENDGTVRVLAVPEYGGGGAVTVPGSTGAAPKKAGTTVNTTIVNNTEREYDKKRAGLKADRDDALEGAATDTAPRILERVAELRKILNSGKVHLGALSGAKLQGDKLLTLAGMRQSEEAKNTEVLHSLLKQTALDAIKTSGLAGGNGLSEGERPFLEGAVGAIPTYEKETLLKMIDLAEKQANHVINRYRNRQQDVPSSYKQGVRDNGLPTAPISTPVVKTSQPTPSKSSIEHLRQNPGLASVFDKTYGKGAAARILKGGR